MKKLLILVLLGAALYMLYQHYDIPALTYARPEITADGRFSDSNAFIKSAYEQRKREVQVRGQGTVTAVLPDKLSGGRFQRFAVRLANGHTLTIEHNGEAAQRLENLQAGEPIEFSGLYEWDSRGGTVSRTHRDSKNRHTAGWIKHKGQTYQ
jgi:hypothetical protein